MNQEPAPYGFQRCHVWESIHGIRAFSRGCRYICRHEAPHESLLPRR